MKSLRAAVIGVGHLGYHHSRLYHSMKDVDLAGVVDTDRERADTVAQEFETQAFDSLEDLLAAGIDAASVVVPTFAHRDTAVELLAAGVDVLVEKPIAASAAEAREMIEAAAAAKRLLQVGHVERFNGAVIALLGAIERPRFIECHRMSPYPNRGHDVSVVHDLMIHDLDVLLALDRSDVVSVDSIGVPIFSQAEDIANARIRFASGCVANLTASRISLERMRKIRIFSESAYVSTDYSAQQVLVYRKKDGGVPDGVSPMEMIAVSPLEVQKEEPLRLELEAFLKSVRDRSNPVVDGEDGLRALQLAEDILEFMRAHR